MPVELALRGLADPSAGAETAADLWGRFSSRLSKMSDAAGQRMDAQQTKAQLDRINDAIGRPVTKVMLDRDDSVILDLGDLVTHQAVQRADDAGLLDSLLASVYKAGDVTFSREELRAKIAGDSTLDKASGGATVVTDLEQKLAAPADSSTDDVDTDEGPEPGPPGEGTAARTRPGPTRPTRMGRRLAGQPVAAPRQGRGHLSDSWPTGRHDPIRGARRHGMAIVPLDVARSRIPRPSGTSTLPGPIGSALARVGRPASLYLLLTDGDSLAVVRLPTRVGVRLWDEAVRKPPGG